jgi:hypothetical protein
LYRSRRRFRSHTNGWQGLDGIQYGAVEVAEVPFAFASVPIKVNDIGNAYNAIMVAGSPAIQATASIQEGVATTEQPHRSRIISSHKTRAQPVLDTLQPVWGWWIYRLPDSAEVTEGCVQKLGRINDRDTELLESLSVGFEPDGELIVQDVKAKPWRVESLFEDRVWST